MCSSFASTALFRAVMKKSNLGELGFGLKSSALVPQKLVLTFPVSCSSLEWLLQAVLEAGIPIDRIGGVSIGAFMGALWAQERDIGQA